MPYRNKVVSVQQAMQILTGQHVARGVAKYVKTTGVLIESEPPVPVQLDGDEWGQTPVQLGITPAALQVLAPEPASLQDT
jgi:diacylglycerol kinase family enzyme